MKSQIRLFYVSATTEIVELGSVDILNRGKECNIAKFPRERLANSLFGLARLAFGEMLTVLVNCFEKVKEVLIEGVRDKRNRNRETEW